jgi:hypothetical protein
MASKKEYKRNRLDIQKRKLESSLQQIVQMQIESRNQLYQNANLRRPRKAELDKEIIKNLIKQLIKKEKQKRIELELVNNRIKEFESKEKTRQIQFVAAGFLMLGLITLPMLLIALMGPGIDHTFTHSIGGISGDITGAIVGLENIKSKGIGGGGKIAIASAPTVDSNEVNSTDPLTNSTTEDLTATVEVNETNSKIIYDWNLNGSSFTVINMPFEKVNSTNNNNARDYSVNSKDAIENGAIVWSATGGFDGNGSYEFDGGDDFLDIGEAPDITEEITIAAWIKPTQASVDDQTIITRGLDQTLSNGDYSYNLRLNDDDATVQFSINTSLEQDKFAKSITQLNNNTWYHVVGTYNTTDVAIYVDGVLESSLGVSGTITPKDVPIEIGNFDKVGGGDDEFSGTIDDVMIMNRSMDAGQVTLWFENKTDLLSSDETIGNDVWTVCVTANDGDQDSIGLSCSTNNVTVNTAPVAPELLGPANASSSTNRTPEFAWSLADDEQVEDLVDSEIQVSRNYDFSTLLFYENGSLGVSNVTFKPTYDLPYDITNYWRVRNYDGKEYGNWSTIFEYNPISLISLSVPVSNVDFGSLAPKASLNTIDDSPAPIEISNDGNVELNIYVSSTVFFTNMDSGSRGNFSFQIAEKEIGSYSSALTDWTNLSTDEEQAVTSLYYVNGSQTANEVYLHLLATVPSEEAPGAKETTITIDGRLD